MIYFKKCMKCGKVIPLLTKNNFVCCGEEMQDLLPNVEEASFEKHIPSYEIKGDYIYVKVNHVMEDNHHIDWIMLVSDTDVYFKNLENCEEASAKFINQASCEIYAYCNLHGLWVAKVK